MSLPRSSITADTPDHKYRGPLYLATRRIIVPNPAKYNWTPLSFAFNATFAAGRDAHNNFLSHLTHSTSKLINPAIYLQMMYNDALMQYAQQRDVFTAPERWPPNVEAIIGHLKVTPYEYATRPYPLYELKVLRPFPMYLISAYAFGLPLWLIADQHDLTVEQVLANMTHASIKMANLPAFVLWANDDGSVSRRRGFTKPEQQGPEWFGYKNGARLPKERKQQNPTNVFLRKPQ